LSGENFSKPESNYALFNLFKALHWLSQMLCFTILVTGRIIPKDLQETINRLDAIAKQIYSALKSKNAFGGQVKT